MKKQVKKIEKYDKNKKQKLCIYLMALTLGVSSLGVNVYAKEEANTLSVIDVNNLNSNSLKDLYQYQMNYLYNTIEELKEFYLNEDKNDIIKNAYPNAYDVINYDFTKDAYYISMGQFIAKNEEDYAKLIIKNNELIRSLNIKSLGNGRDPEYGIIKDNNSELGFRKKTLEDKELINKYTDILGNPFIISSDLLKVLSTDEVNEEDLLNALESVINNQINFIKSTQNKLRKFYDETDSKNIIKNAYDSAYLSYNSLIGVMYTTDGYGHYSVVRDNSLSTSELIKNYLDIIKENNILIGNFKIKSLGNSRDPEYGIIKDSSSELGFRKKTLEDKELINEYTDIVGNLNVLPISVIECLGEKNISDKKMVK